jgi:hypothetical protein
MSQALYCAFINIVLNLSEIILILFLFESRYSFFFNNRCDYLGLGRK